MRYDEYLQSDEWKVRRAQARQRAKNRCKHCGGPPDHVHHVRYPKNFKDDVLENLIVVCESCHMKHHGIRGKEMNSPQILRFDESPLIADKIQDKIVFRFDDAFIALEYSEKGGIVESSYFLPNQLRSSAWAQIPEQHRIIVSEQISGGASREVRYITERGVYHMAMRSSSPKSERFREWLSEVCESLRKYGVYPPPSQELAKANDEFALLQGMLDGLRDAKRTATQALVISQKNTQDLEYVIEKLENVETIANDWVRNADFLRSKNSKLSEKSFGQFLSRFVMDNGGINQPDVGWFSKTGEQLSKKMPAPDTRFGYINKWKRSLVEQTWPFFQKQSEVNGVRDFFNA